MGHPSIQTPHMNALVQGGVLFPVTHNVASTCIPSLEGILTGRYQKDWGTGNNYRPAYLTIPIALRAAGYMSYGAGKFWSGYRETGFDQWLEHGRDEIGRDTMQPIYDFIDAQRAASPTRPFFVWYAPHLPHKPLNPPERFLHLYDGQTDIPGVSGVTELDSPGERLKYAGNISWLDDTVGQLVGFLEARGLRNNTLLLYVSDNGWGLPHSKNNFSQNGFRTVLWANLPGEVVSGMRRDELVHTIDILPTLIDYAGLSIPSNLEGKSLRSLLEGKHVPWRQYLFGMNFDAATTHELVHSRYLITTDGLEFFSEQNQLFDLTTDPNETTNLIGDSRYAARLPAFRQALDAWAMLATDSATLVPIQEIDATRRLWAKRLKDFDAEIHVRLAQEADPRNKNRLLAYQVFVKHR